MSFLKSRDLEAFVKLSETELSHPLFASTLANGMNVLRCFSPERPILSNKELATELGLTRPTISRLTHTLMAMGYLSKESRTGHYTLGPAVLSLAYPLLAQLTVRHLAMDGMSELSRFANGSVSMGMRDRLQVVYVETVDDGSRVGTRPDIGTMRPILTTAIGRALLFSEAPEARDILLAQLHEHSASQRRKTEDALEESFSQLTESGFCTSFGDWRPDLFGLAAPLKTRGEVPLAINVTVAAYKTTKDHVIKTLGPRLVELVRSIEARTGLS